VSALAEEDVERHARAVLAVCDWGRSVDVFITVDDAVNIVTAVMDAWKPVNTDEAAFDVTRANSENIRTARLHIASVFGVPTHMIGP
jgi:hypothetical protein